VREETKRDRCNLDRLRRSEWWQQSSSMTICTIMTEFCVTDSVRCCVVWRVEDELMEETGKETLAARRARRLLWWVNCLTIGADQALDA
jgi:hypothetical protein